MAIICHRAERFAAVGAESCIDDGAIVAAVFTLEHERLATAETELRALRGAWHDLPATFVRAAKLRCLCLSFRTSHLVGLSFSSGKILLEGRACDKTTESEGRRRTQCCTPT